MPYFSFDVAITDSSDLGSLLIGEYQLKRHTVESDLSN